MYALAYYMLVVDVRYMRRVLGADFTSDELQRGQITGLYGDNGKENGSYWMIIGYILGL